MDKAIVSRKDRDKPVAQLRVNKGQIKTGDVDKLFKLINAWLKDYKVESKLTLDDVKSSNHFYDYANMRKVDIDTNSIANIVIITISEHTVDYYIENDNY